MSAYLALLKALTAKNGETPLPNKPSKPSKGAFEPFEGDQGRISFLTPGRARGAPVQGQAFFYFGENAERFERVFSIIGAVVEPRRLANVA